SGPFSGFGLNPFFDSFFKDFFDPYLERQPERSTLGSGVILDGKRGLIITNAHVIANAGTIKVTLQDEREFEAEIVGADPDFDLAVLRIQSKAVLPEVKMGSSDDLMIGETVIAIGNPFGFSHTITTGVISALDRSIRTDDRVFHEFIQIDASINPGNSGGPLLNINGELIGINTAIYAKAQGIGFAIPISKTRKIISDLIAHGEVIEPWIGIIVQNIDAGLARYLNVPAKSGVLVKMVENGSPAAKAGAREGDIILALDNRKIVSEDDFQSTMRNYSVGDKLNLKLRRNAESRTLSVVASQFPMEKASALGYRLLGIRTEDLTPDSRVRLNIAADSGALISELNPQSYLAQIGARKGDVIRRINEVPINNSKDFNEAIVKYRYKKSIVVLLQRGDQGYYITIEL
ncbi:MAG: trypsin-like peptidase domain-containing protein, partial [Desulfobacterales bacterium]|nr:trypsin-like peptidase domain-containing protein [Desulfobacterales bacterium]